MKNKKNKKKKRRKRRSRRRRRRRRRTRRRRRRRRRRRMKRKRRRRRRGKKEDEEEEEETRKCKYLTLHSQWITMSSDTLYSTTFRNSTSSKQVYFPPSLRLTPSIFSGPRVSFGFSGSGFRTLFNKTPSLNQEILLSGVAAAFPLSVKLQVSVTSSPCCKAPILGTKTLGISFPKKQTS